MQLSIKNLSIDTLIYGFGNVFTRLITFLLLPLYTNILTPSEYGIITIIYVFMGFMNIIYHYGLDSSFLKYYAKEKNIKNQKIIFSTAFFLNLFSSIILSFLIFLFSKQLSFFFFKDQTYQELFNITSSILFLDSLSHIPFALLRIEKKPFIFISLKLINVCITLFFNIYFLIIEKIGIEGVFYSVLIASITSFLSIIIASFKSFKIILKLDYIKKFLKFGLPFLPAGIASITMESIDRYILSIMTNNDIVGIYTAGYKLGIFMLIFSTAFNYAWQPFFLNFKENNETRKLFSKIFTFYISIAIMIWLTISFFLKEVITIQIFEFSLLGKAYMESIHFVPIILLSYIFQGAYYNFLPGIYYKEKTKIIPSIIIFSAIINIFTNILLIPVYGMIGSAIATLFGHLSMAVLTYFYSKKLFSIKYEWFKIFVIFFISSLLIIFSQLFFMSLAVKTLICIIFYLFIFKSKMISF